MAEQTAFRGFPRECPRFYEELKRNNDKAWFERQRGAYESQVLTPARRFIVALGARLKKIAPGIHADPRTDRSIFRIHRDTRFSREKLPYKTHLGLWFWEGSGPRMECSGFYFHLEPPNLLLGAGIYMIPKYALTPYREAVVEKRRGAALQSAARKVLAVKGCTIGGVHYKRTPRGFDPGHPNADFLRHNGLWAGVEQKIPREFYSARLIEYCHERCKAMAPLHRWIHTLMEEIENA